MVRVRLLSTSWREGEGGSVEDLRFPVRLERPSGSSEPLEISLTELAEHASVSICSTARTIEVSVARSGDSEPSYSHTLTAASDATIDLVRTHACTCMHATSL
jgi:hypothetical protein